jgi:hypothetical protein
MRCAQVGEWSAWFSHPINVDLSAFGNVDKACLPVRLRASHGKAGEKADKSRVAKIRKELITVDSAAFRKPIPLI